MDEHVLTILTLPPRSSKQPEKRKKIARTGCTVVAMRMLTTPARQARGLQQKARRRRQRAKARAQEKGELRTEMTMRTLCWRTWTEVEMRCQRMKAPAPSVRQRAESALLLLLLVRPLPKSGQRCQKMTVIAQPVRQKRPRRPLAAHKQSLRLHLLVVGRRKTSRQ